MSSILAGITSGIENTYSYIASQYTDGLTLKNLTSARSNSTLSQNINSSFASYLQTNFKSIDSNGDGVITSDEMTKLTNKLSSSGMTKTELQQLYASGNSGISESKMTEILEHFEDMDTNHDGKLTDAEISAYSVNSSKQQKEDEMRLKAAGDMSVFYGSDSSSDSTYSILSYRYKNSSGSSSS
ncbi:MAG: EF-hand domain-containing protein [Clostridiaceae bacterium]|jgi:Ca2+-binding EF-hand superfamily protein|nr:EF-hand domain-containing protein [Clostridiaceae bacterium]